MSAYPSTPTGLRVCVVAHADSEDASLPVCNALQRAGAEVHLGQPELSDAAIVVVLSAGLLGSGATLPEPGQFPNARLVPISFHAVDATRVPAGLAELNWISWHEDGVEAALHSVLTACTTDLASYRTGQAVLARAEGWEIAGRHQADLMSDRKQLATMESALAHSGITPSPVLVNYLQASANEIRRLRRRAVRRFLLRTALAIALISGGVVVANQVSNMRDRSKLELVASLDDIDLYPHVNSIKLAALVVAQAEQGDTPSSATIDQLTGMLSSPWPRSSTFTSPDGFGTNDIVPDDDGGAFTIDGGGTIWHTASGAASPTRVVKALDSPGLFLAVAGAGTVFAAGDSSTVVVVRGAARSELRLPDTIVRLRLADDAKQLAVSVRDGVRLIDLDASPLTEGTLYADVLDSAFVDGHLIGLRRAGDRLQLVRLDSGVIERTFADPSGPLSVAAVGPSGEIAVQAADGRMMAAAPGGDLAPTGLWVPDLLNSIAVTGSGELLYTPKGWTTKVYDLHARIPLANVCRESTALTLRLSPNHKWLSCDYAAQKSIWNLDDIRPVTTQGDPKPETEVTAGAFSARVLHSGQLEVGSHGATRTWDLTGSGARSGASREPVATQLQLTGEISTLATVPDGTSLAIGSSSGGVAIADVNGTELHASTTWSSPDASPVKAITLHDSQATIVTATATWRIPVCTGCSRNMGALIMAVHRRQLPCYPPSLKEAVPSRLLAKLGVALCQEQ